MLLLCVCPRLNYYLTVFFFFLFLIFYPTFLSRLFYSFFSIPPVVIYFVLILISPYSPFSGYGDGKQGVSGAVGRLINGKKELRDYQQQQVDNNSKPKQIKSILKKTGNTSTNTGISGASGASGIKGPSSENTRIDPGSSSDEVDSRRRLKSPEKSKKKTQKIEKRFKICRRQYSLRIRGKISIMGVSQEDQGEDGGTGGRGVLTVSVTRVRTSTYGCGTSEQPLRP